VPSQCIVTRSAGIGPNTEPRGRLQYCANVALKINAKLDGINVRLAGACAGPALAAAWLLPACWAGRGCAASWPSRAICCPGQQQLLVRPPSAPRPSQAACMHARRRPTPPGPLTTLTPAAALRAAAGQPQQVYPVIGAAPFMVFGADVTHPTSRDESEPSVAAVVRARRLLQRRARAARLRPPCFCRAAYARLLLGRTHLAHAPGTRLRPAHPWRRWARWTPSWRASPRASCCSRTARS
jgi:hypothetical protein